MLERLVKMPWFNDHRDLCYIVKEISPYKRGILHGFVHLNYLAVKMPQNNDYGTLWISAGAQYW